MAYTVGSASVSIVPDFKGAQLAITAWFRKQSDELRIPVKPTIDQNSVNNVEREASRVGDKVGKAISEGASSSLSRGLVGQVSREVAKLEKDLERARRSGETASAALARAEVKLLEARKNSRTNTVRMFELEQAVERAQIRVSEANTQATRTTDQLSQARGRLAEVTAQAAREAGEKVAEAQRRQAEAEVRLALRTAERVAAERARIQRQAEIVEARERERVVREEARFAEKAARDYMVAYNRAIKDAEKAEIQVEIDKRKAIKEGQETGGLIARSIDREIHQNAGLIAGAISGVLIAGAPLALAAAGALFAGIGAIAVAQNDHIRQTWKGLWATIKADTISDTAVLVPVFERVAGRIGASFQRMRPLLQDAFSAVGPQIESFTESLTQAAENALPGLVEAVRAGGPVVEGLGVLLERTGTGLSEFFSTLAEHAPAAGDAFAEVGDVFAELLPLLGEILGQGAELASTVLPAVSTALGFTHTVLLAVSDALESIGLSLPTVLTGFLAFRAVQGVSRALSNFAGNMDLAASRGGNFAGVQGRLAGAAAKASQALPAVGFAAAAIGFIMAESEQNIDSWVGALKQGGTAAEKARADMQNFDQSVDDLSGAFGGVLAAGTPLGGLLSFIADDTEQADKAFEDWLESLTPVEEAQRNLDIATRALEEGLGDEATTASELAGLQGEVASAAAALAEEQENLALATQGVTEAMIEQVEQSRAQVDSAFAYTKAVDDLEDAQADLATLQASGTATAEELSDAAFKVAEAYRDVGQAASDKAMDALPASMDEQSKALVGAQAELEYYRGLLEAGIDLPPELDEHVKYLEGVVAGADLAALEQEKLRAATEDSVGALAGLSAMKVEPEVGLNDGVFQVKKQGALAGLQELADKRAEATLDADDYPYRKKLTGALEGLRNFGDQHPTPQLDADGRPAGKKVGDALAGLRNFAAQRPTPPLNADGRPAEGQVGKALGRLATFAAQRPTPVLGAKDLASGVIAGVQGALAGLRDKSVTLTTNIVTRYTTIGTGPNQATIGASGGAIEDLRPRMKFDGGGAIVGRGGPRDDLVPFLGPNPAVRYSAANGEHLLDGRDVALMGGQAGVYAFREMLNSGRFNTPGVDNGVRQMLAGGTPSAPAAASGDRHYNVYTSDNPAAILRTLRAKEQQDAALAAAW